MLGLHREEECFKFKERSDYRGLCAVCRGGWGTQTTYLLATQHRYAQISPESKTSCQHVKKHRPNPGFWTRKYNMTASEKTTPPHSITIRWTQRLVLLQRVPCDLDLICTTPTTNVPTGCGWRKPGSAQVFTIKEKPKSRALL